MCVGSEKACLNKVVTLNQSGELQFVRTNCCKESEQTVPYGRI